jgi:putative SOS response-associated peptidase YedK
MCGRFTLKTPVADWLESLFPSEGLLPDIPLTPIESIKPRYNIAPTQDILVLYVASDGKLSINSMRWGLVPFWADSLKASYSMFNARSETLLEKSSFRSLVSGHRCVVLADGYYEWQAVGPKQKRPFWIHRTGESPFGMAGLWTKNRKVQPDNELLSTTVITVPANKDTRDVHERMPAMLLNGSEIMNWLGPDDAQVESIIHQCLQPAREGEFHLREVSTQVNNARTEGAELLAASLRDAGESES